MNEPEPPPPSYQTIYGTTEAPPPFNPQPEVVGQEATLYPDSSPSLSYNATPHPAYLRPQNYERLPMMNKETAESLSHTLKNSTVLQKELFYRAAAANKLSSQHLAYLLQSRPKNFISDRPEIIRIFSPSLDSVAPRELVYLLNLLDSKDESRFLALQMMESSFPKDLKEEEIISILETIRDVDKLKALPLLCLSKISFSSKGFCDILQLIPSVGRSRLSAIEIMVQHCASGFKIGFEVLQRLFALLKKHEVLGIRCLTSVFPPINSFLQVKAIIKSVEELQGPNGRTSALMALYNLIDNHTPWVSFEETLKELPISDRLSALSEYSRKLDGKMSLLQMQIILEQFPESSTRDNPDRVEAIILLMSRLSENLTKDEALFILSSTHSKLRPRILPELLSQLKSFMENKNTRVEMFVEFLTEIPESYNHRTTSLKSCRKFLEGKVTIREICKLVEIFSTSNCKMDALEFLLPTASFNDIDFYESSLLELFPKEKPRITQMIKLYQTLT